MDASFSNFLPDSENNAGANICFLNVEDRSHFVKHTDVNTELICVLSGNPSLLVGSHVEKCRSGDFLLIGKDLLHAVQIEPGEYAELVILHLNDKFLDDTVVILKDFQPVGDLFGQRNRGLLWRNQSRDLITAVLNLKTASGIAAVVGLIEVLSELASQKEYHALNQIRSAPVFAHDITEEKIKRVFDFTRVHYREAITLQQVASQVNFTVTSFCRYFKKMTGKNYYNYLNEVRIDNACYILMENNSKSIEEVCYIVGYSSPSTFYKHFKKIVNMTPTEYQDKAMAGSRSISAA
ncbi:AraC family transcriptional regulator [Dyadobacter sp. CY312]|uniref:helix-turn-helix domain-containing protein n=1 Tax=Dyadobacter sp. CY312 TaxID=2907303 RepID=UPI001F49255B|nr:AraC family transcriptional regulator [Dyadobacter sp. CY312]MCE7040259.1 AraC family transcriptional regulator [Dyadobacter sp. CY312]